MLRLFADNLLPVFLAAGAGYLLAWRFRMDPRPVSQIAFFALAPCFVFDVIVGSEVPGADLLRMIVFALVALAIPAALAALAARWARWPRTVTAAVVLTVLLPNAGNYGLSVNRFAFGEAGLAQASLFFVTSSMLTFTVGVFIASLGKKSLGAALAGLPRIPAVWAVAAAFVVLRTGWSLPFPVERTVGLMGDACIPVFLIILGMQLQGKGFHGLSRPLLLAAGMRLLGGMAAGIVLAGLFPLGGVARQSAILQSAMPSAVVCIILAGEFDVEPALVTAVVFLTTVLSPLTLTPLLAWLI